MDAHNTLQLLLDANTHVLTAIYTPPRPARPVAAETAETALPAGESDANEDADASDEDAERAGDAALASDLPNWDSLAAAAAEQGWTTEALDNHAVIAFIDMCRDAVAPVQGTIGKVQDGSYELELSADRMAAMITLLPPRAAVPSRCRRCARRWPTRASSTACWKRNWPRPSNRVAPAPCWWRKAPRPRAAPHPLRKPAGPAQAARPGNRRTGTGGLPRPGQPAAGHAGHAAHAPHSPLPGIDGRDVLGQPVLPDEMADTQFSSDMSGVEIDPDDPLLLRAAIAGSPKLINQGVQVNPVVEVDAVDLTTGNINFEGSLQVRGDISATMEVRVTGDVVVNGTMEAALVEAGGNVTVKGGIIGMAEAMQDASGPARTAHIVCGGELKARFIENAIISAGQNVEVEREIRHAASPPAAVNVGAANAQQTAIMGGQIRALQAVRAGTIGSPAGVPTLVQAGLDPHADIKRTALTRKRVKMNEEKAKLEQLLLFLHSHPERATGDVVDRARNTHAKLGRDLVSLEEEEAQLVRDLQPIHTASITASRRYCSGVKIQIGNKMQEFLEDQVGGKAALEAGEIVIR